MPSGNPLRVEVTKCPIPEINAPSRIPKYKAAKNPGVESKDTDGMGLGVLIVEPITVSAEKIANRAKNQGEEIFNILLILVVLLAIFLSSFLKMEWKIIKDLPYVLQP